MESAVVLQPLRALMIADQHRFQRDDHHVVETGLALLGGHLLMRADVVGHGADHSGFRAVFGGQTIDARRFHFDADDAVLLHSVKQAGVGVVEQIR